MPIYEYRCTKCNSISEHLLLRSSEKPEKCPRCGAALLDRVMSAAAVISKSGTPSCDMSCGDSRPCDMAGSGCCPSCRIR